eukprot:SAG31_NODE_5807_length_2319_cov_1.617117_3_plen_101_part_00
MSLTGCLHIPCFLACVYMTLQWFGDDKASEWSYLGARLRSAARLGGTNMSWGGYIVPRGPTGHVARGTPGLTMRALTMVGNGAVRSVSVRSIVHLLWYFS